MFLFSISSSENASPFCFVCKFADSLDQIFTSGNFSCFTCFTIKSMFSFSLYFAKLSSSSHMDGHLSRADYLSLNYLSQQLARKAAFYRGFH